MSERPKDMSHDKNSWLDQIEEARRRLMLTIRSGKQTAALAQLAADVDASVQDVMDEITDGANAHG